MTDPTRATRPVGGPPPGSPPPPGPPGGPPVPPEPGDGPDWRRLTIGALAGLTVLLALVLLLVLVSGGDDEDDVATDASTTTTSSAASSSTTDSTTTSTADTTTTTSTSTTTTGPPTTTTSTSTTTSTAPPTPSTVAPERCTGRTGPDQPGPVAEVFYEAWTLGDEACAEQVATDEAIDDLFVFDGRGADWSFEGCEQDGDLPQTDCFFRYEGGSATFELRFGAVDGWRVESVTFTAD